MIQGLETGNWRVESEGRRLETESPVRRVVIEHVRPSVDGGRFPIKRTVGESVIVVADIFVDGHDVLSAVLRDKPTSSSWHEVPMRPVAPGTDEWTGTFTVDEMGWHEYAVEAWVDPFRTWRRGLEIKAATGQDLSTDLLEGSLLVREAAARAEERLDEDARAQADCLLVRADAIAGGPALEARIAAALNADLAALMDRHADRSRATRSAALRVWVDRERARFGAWYEMFPRSAGPDPHRSGTFREAAAMLPRIADLGFDVVYLPPIHPIGRTDRKGPNNSLACGPGDPGSPWAIGSADGGHTAVDPALGTLADFALFRAEAARLGLEVAIDLAWQCSPDHPWVREHPEWFRRRLDGTIKYAENPPKRYQDIYPFDFACDDWRSLWRALLDVTLFWTGRGVRIFRVDNPHTKTFNFWEWLIEQVHARHPDAIFLSEAFTRPKPMQYLAKAGFAQSYTYFTWLNSKPELREYLDGLTSTDVREYFRPNLFVNTPDILHAYLQEGGRPAFEARLLLAATLGASYGIYSGFELCENRAVPGSEEYADSEKYQYRKRDWDAPGHIQELVARVNEIRHAHPALQYDWTLRFHDTDNPHLVAYSKTSPDGGDVVMAVVNLDPQHMQHGQVEVPVDADSYTVLDLVDDAAYAWHRGWNYVRLEPYIRQGHILWLPKPRA